MLIRTAYRSSAALQLLIKAIKKATGATTAHYLLFIYYFRCYYFKFAIESNSVEYFSYYGSPGYYELLFLRLRIFDNYDFDIYLSN